MDPIEHTSAEASYYDTRAGFYDEFNEDNAKGINGVLESILKEHGVSSVLDLTCGTGLQVFWLKDAGFDVVGSDISKSMLEVARGKAELKNLEIKFLEGDCRDIKVGSFDAVISVFNAIGHLTREDFEKTIQNVYSNLNTGGLYAFDIFNLDYLRHEKNITKLTIDWISVSEGKKVREVQFSTISDEGILTSYSTYIEQENETNLTKVREGYVNTLQVYSAEELKIMLERNGFIVLEQTGIGREVLGKESTERILTIAKKI